MKEKEKGVDYGPYDVYYHLGFPTEEEKKELETDPHNRYEQFIDMEEWLEAERQQTEK